MSALRHPRLAVALVGCLLVVACDGPMRPAPPTAPSPAPSSNISNRLDALAGTYVVTIDLPETCAELPETERHRTYAATLEKSPYSSLGIRIAGAGYATPTVVGDMWDDGVGKVRLDWNNFDIGGCDGLPESMPDGRPLMICGRGDGVIEGPTIAGNLRGQVFLETEGKGDLSCTGTFPLTFRRAIDAADELTRVP